MPDIDLKAATPDTSLPSTGFLFGADSQSAASPSVYSTQTVATALLGSTSLTGATVTTSSPVLDLAQTWNAAGVTFTGLKANFTRTLGSANSRLVDLQIGGVSKFYVNGYGAQLVNTSDGYGNIGVLASASDTQAVLAMGMSATTGAASAYFGIGPGGSTAPDTFLTRRAAASLRLGAADAATAVAQTLGVQSVAAGQTNVAGANLTITGSQGTGSGAGGSIVFQVAPAGSSGTAQNALATALTINADRTVSIGGLTINPGNGVGTFVQTFGILMQTSNEFGIRHGNNDALVVRPVSSGSPNILLRDASNATQAHLWGEAANTLALRNGGTSGSPVPQTFNIYNWTDGTNFERASLGWATNNFQLLVNAGGTGNQRGLQIGMAGSGGFINFWAGTPVWQITSGGTLQAVTDNTYDIGASGANRPRHAYLAQLLFLGSGARIGSGSAGSITLENNAGTSFDRLMFGGTTSSFPAIKRSSTTLQARLADDSGFASVQGKLTTDTAYTAGAPTATGYIILYDSTGTAYRVPAVLN